MLIWYQNQVKTQSKSELGGFHATPKKFVNSWPLLKPPLTCDLALIIAAFNRHAFFVTSSSPLSSPTINQNAVIKHTTTHHIALIVKALSSLTRNLIVRILHTRCHTPGMCFKNPHVSFSHRRVQAAPSISCHPWFISPPLDLPSVGSLQKENTACTLTRLVKLLCEFDLVWLATRCYALTCACWRQP